MSSAGAEAVPEVGTGGGTFVGSGAGAGAGAGADTGTDAGAGAGAGAGNDPELDALGVFNRLVPCPHEILLNCSGSRSSHSFICSSRGLLGFTSSPTCKSEMPLAAPICLRLGTPLFSLLLTVSATMTSSAPCTSISDRCFSRLALWSSINSVDDRSLVTTGECGLDGLHSHNVLGASVFSTGHCLLLTGHLHSGAQKTERCFPRRL